MHQIRELRLMNWKYASFFPWSFPAFSFVAQSQLNCMLTTLVEHLLLTMKIKHSHMYLTLLAAGASGGVFFDLGGHRHPKKQ